MRSNKICPLQDPSKSFNSSVIKIYIFLTSTNSVTWNANKVQNAELCWLLSNLYLLLCIRKGQLRFWLAYILYQLRSWGVFYPMQNSPLYYFQKGRCSFLLRHFRFIIHSLTLYKQNSWNRFVKQTTHQWVKCTQEFHEGKAIPSLTWTGPEGSWRLRLPIFQENRYTKVARLLAVRSDSLYPDRKYSRYLFL
jgi:hypothetical protein